MAKLKLYSSELRSTELPQRAFEALAAVGIHIPVGRDQGEVYVVAGSRRMAASYARSTCTRVVESGFTVDPSGSEVDALRAAGEFVAEGVVLAVPASRSGVLRWSELNSRWEYLGKVVDSELVSAERVDVLEQAIDAVENSIGPVPHGLDAELALVLAAARAQLDRLRKANS